MTPPSHARSLPHSAVPSQRHPDAPAPGTPLPSHYDRCFTCGPDHPTGLRMQVNAGEGVSVEASFTVTEDHQGVPDWRMGGLLASAVDETFGALGWLLRVPMVTARLETASRASLSRSAVSFDVVARCDGISRRRVYLSAEGRLGDGEGDVAIRAFSVFVQVPIEHFVKHGRRQELDAASERPEVLTALSSFEVNP